MESENHKSSCRSYHTIAHPLSGIAALSAALRQVHHTGAWSPWTVTRNLTHRRRPGGTVGRLSPSFSGPDTRQFPRAVTRVATALSYPGMCYAALVITPGGSNRPAMRDKRRERLQRTSALGDRPLFQIRALLSAGQRAQQLKLAPGKRTRLRSNRSHPLFKQPITIY